VNRVTLVDTGPLVAFLSAGDQHHPWAADAFDSLTGRLISCEAVISEASFVLGRDRHRRSVVLELAERMGIEVHPLSSELRSLRQLMDKYASVPMSFADACLVRLADLHPAAVVMTCDADFRIYRRSNRRVIKLLMPP
jgi:predicted nucleic acid-binding protein